MTAYKVENAPKETVSLAIVLEDMDSYPVTGGFVWIHWLAANITRFEIKDNESQTATTTIIQEKAEGSMLGRVFGLMGAMYSGFLPVGMAIFGPLADILPLQWIMVGSGIALVLVTVYLQVKSKSNL